MPEGGCQECESPEAESDTVKFTSLGAATGTLYQDSIEERIRSAKSRRHIINSRYRIVDRVSTYDVSCHTGELDPDFDSMSELYFTVDALALTS
jgi:hypothetical protein